MGKTPSSFKAIEVRDEKGEWRVKIINDATYFADEQKQIFLDEYEKHARMGDAARAAGVTPGRVKTALEEDEIFAEACLNAEETYRSRLKCHVQDLIFNGTEKVTYDRQGTVISREKNYPIRLIELELKRHDAAYKNERQGVVNLNAEGGVLIVPPEANSLDDWKNRFGAKTIEASARPAENRSEGAERPENVEGEAT